ncbi:polysaccharide biosynthesis C-terminal domain-containing protein [Jannaschia sp. Os4]|uniref:MATE family efflux transporter n=1 Tax=Jannaschia sp. Os4 TaxID=2807617 RepID=UPI001939D612|nr:MATE family efflux transporter [Jannaschia sp. Os4]MBM2575628.1 polysaccharide biosynthesis C-terminal domain-containing protein [Jannaschia sp. Os4]
MSKSSLNALSVPRALLKVAGPMVVGILAVLSVGLVDAFFLGRLGGDPLAAVGFIFPVTMAIGSLSIGLSAGANAVISQAIGQDRDDDCITRMGLHAVGLGVVFAVLAAMAFFFLDAWLLGLIGAEGGPLEEALTYTPWWCLSFPFLVTLMQCGAIFRAHGEGTTAAGVMVASAVVNIASTPVLIFGLGPLPEMGTAGAAAATFLAQSLAAMLSLTIAWRKGFLAPCDDVWAELGANARSIGGVGGPAALSNAINPAGMAVVTGAVASVGAAYVGGFGAATRVESLAMVPMLALSAGIGPVVGQAWGAEDHDRAREALRTCLLICVGYGLAVALALTFAAGPIATLFSEDETSRQATATYLRIAAWSFFAYGILVVGNAALNAISRAGLSMTVSILRVAAIYAPLAWLGVTLFGYAGIVGATVVANVAAAGMIVVAARRSGLMASGGDAVPAQA